MAYSTNNSSSTISVTNFGAKGDGVTNDTNAFQQAINSLYPRGGGTIFVPKGNYLTSGYINITGHNISLIGEKGLSTITTVPSGDYKKINISGASGASLIGLNIWGGRVPLGRYNTYISTVNLYSASNFIIKDCDIAHSEGLLVEIRGNTHRGLINNCSFSDFHIALRGQSNDTPSQPYSYITVTESTFINSWGSNAAGGQSYFGAIKFENIGSEYNGYTTGGRSCGHIIQGNTFSGTSQMGVELFGYISESVVANNVFDNITFGVSIAAGSFNCNVSDNIFRGCSNYGIELADSQNVVASNNVIYGATGGYFHSPFNLASGNYALTSGAYCYTPIGIIANGVNRRPNFYTIIGNTITDCSNAGINAYLTDQTNIVGNTIVTRAQNPGQCFNATASQNVLFQGNNMNMMSTGTYFIFLDASSQPNSGIYIRGNDFAGNVSQWGILYYNNGNTGSNNGDILIENNVTNGVKYCGYGMANAYQNPPNKTLHRNNYGPLNGGYSILDGQIPDVSTPYQTSSVKYGFQNYGNSTWYVPTGGITGDGIWLCAWSGYQGGQQNNLRMLISTNYQYGGLYSDLEFFATMSPYGGYDTLSVSPSISLISPILQVKTIAVPNEVRNAVWVKMRPVSAAAGANAPVSIYFSTPSELKAGVWGWTGYSTYKEPPDTANNAKIVLDNFSGGQFYYPQFQKYSVGIAVGSSGYVGVGSQRSGVLSLYDASNYEQGPMLSFGKRIKNTSIALYDDLVGPTIYGMGIAPFNFRFHVDAPTSRFSFHDAPAGNELFTINGNGRVGINVNTPGSALHVNGSVCLSGIATSTTATLGGATLPANPIGFVTINITGTNFKIPYYGI